jgi:NADP-dependent 3-hydroxy acid dehydrogenase YdfG
MLLADKNAVIYGAAGAMGATVARAFAAEGATVFLTGRNAAALHTMAKDITASGGTAHSAVVDAWTRTRSKATPARSPPRPGAWTSLSTRSPFPSKASRARC